MQTLYTDHATISDKHPKRLMPPVYYIQASFVLSCYAALLRRELHLITQLSALPIADISYEGRNREVFINFPLSFKNHSLTLQKQTT